MNSVDVKCPICGAMNESLNLEETDGWMECESCGNAVQIMKYVKHQACTVLSNARLSGARTAFAKVMAKEYGDAGGLDDLLLVLPEL